MKIEDLTGRKFNKLTFISFVGRLKDRTIWLCRCECGRMINANAYNVKIGHRKSCGCASESHKSNLKHGLSSHKIYPVWRSMRDRCNKPNHLRYDDYGGRGIRVCERWLKFENFVEDMFGSYREGLTLERNDVNGNYEKKNCSWETRKVQARNTRANHIVEYKDFKGSIAELAEKIGMKSTTLHRRISSQKWAIEKAVETPIDDAKKNNKYKKTYL